MTKIKLCGMTRPCDIEAVNELLPDYIGFVLCFEKSHRNITAGTAEKLRALLDPRIQAVGVFVDAPVDTVAGLLNEGIIELAQLHGSEDEAYLTALREKTEHKTIIKAFKATEPDRLEQAKTSTADLVLLDSGKGYGISYDVTITSAVKRPYFLAGGITIENVEAAIAAVHPFAVDVSSGIETDQRKDPVKMAEFVRRVRRTQ